MTPIRFSILDTAIGRLTVARDAQGLTCISFEDDDAGSEQRTQWKRDDEALRPAVRQLTEYFEGQRKVFELPLSMNGTPFQKRVWQALSELPYGTTTSYAKLAHRIGSPSSARAVGGANGRNRIAIVIPCHRVIGADGSLTGYAAGKNRKQWLLELEERSARGEIHNAQFA